MTTSIRTPQQRDRRFARVRRLSDAILMGGIASAVIFVGYASNTAHSAVTATSVPAVASAPASAITTSYNGAEGDDSSYTAITGSSTVQNNPTTATKAYTPPATAPGATKTVCTTTPSGRMVCH
jgi:hypothetical protein